MASRTLNPRQALFIKLYTDRKSKTFGNAYQSAVAAGYSPETAKRILADLSEKARTTMLDALEAKGITSDLLADRHKSLLDKREVVFIRDGKESYHELTDQPDSVAVKAGLELAYKLRGDFAPERHEHSINAIEDLLDESEASKTGPAPQD